ncbi:MAG: glucose-1-phosphate adenylyltransferase subunit GlgD [Streptococcaceae bacterium]|jgi:glucose-1-phosphate adenylyltransferase|nr:glucose-1-phosphate adenylyltransferase subunit GlgD [Streptococcaceae bacterium]
MSNANKMCALLSNVSKYEGLRPLTDDRPLATLPFDCKYRLIDFPLSAVSNAGINEVFMVFNQGETQSVFDHIGGGKEWGLDSLSSGMFVYMEQDFAELQSKGHPYYEPQLNFLRKSRAPYTVLMSSKFVCNLDLNAILRVHQASGRNVTAVAKKCDPEMFNTFDTVIRQDENNRYYGVEAGTLHDMGDSEYLSLNAFICNTDWLIGFIEEMQGREEFTSISSLIRRHLWDTDPDIYEFTGYLSNITSVKAYYDANIAMLDPTNFTALLYGRQPVYTKIKNEVPTYFAPNSWAHNAQFGSGCIIEGVVIDSLISRGSIIEQDTIVDKSLVFTNTRVKAGAQLKYCILDKNVTVENGVHIEGSPQRPVVIKKGQYVSSDIYEP